MNNIGVTFVKMNKYDEAISTFENCMEEKPDFRAGLNLILCASTLEDREKMREGFQRLLEIQLDVDDEDKYVPHNVQIRLSIINGCKKYLCQELHRTVE